MKFCYPLYFQTVLPDDFRDNATFRSLLGTLRTLGFSGVELNMSDPRQLKAVDVRDFLGSFDLELSMLATGLTSKRLELSLSHPDESVRRRSIDICREMIDWVAGSTAGIIVGFLKGSVAGDAGEARERFSRSLAQIIPYAEPRSIGVLIEATNRYESSVANTIDETAHLLREYGAGSAQLLPDTFHMNIEEAHMFESLRMHHHRFRSIHLSDNNRRFPGLGAIDFGGIITFLKQIGYRGRLAIEGNVKNDVEAELRSSLTYLAPLLEE